MEKQGSLSTYLHYVLFSALGMLGISCYILADTFFVARGLGSDGLTALNLAIPVYTVIHGTGLMLGMGGAIRYTVLRSQGQEEAANRSFLAALCWAAVLALVYELLGLFASHQLARLLGADDRVYAMTRTYLRVLLFFSPAFLLNDIFLCFIRNDGAPQLSMAAMVTGSLGNIFLDYVFIFPLGMGIFGAVFATGLAPILSMAVLSLHRLRHRNQFHLRATLPRRSELRDAVWLGIPSLITELSSGVVILVFNSVFLKLGGNLAVAAYGVVANLSLVAISLHTGVAQGSQPLLSRAHGSGDRASGRQTLRYAVLTIALLSAAVYALLALLKGPVVAAFNRDGDALLQRIAEEGLLLYFLALPFAGWNIVLSGYFAAEERTIPAQVLSLLRGLVIIVPAAFLMAALWGMEGAWLSFPVTEALVFAVGLVLARRRPDL